MTLHTRIPVPDYVAFDIETTGLVPEEDHIIEVGLVRFKNGEPVERWTSLVKPEGKVGLKTLRLTGIPLEELEASVGIFDICREIEEFRGDLPLVGHNPEFDVAFLAKVIPNFPGVAVYDTLELARIVYPGFATYRLSDLTQNLNIVLDDAHRACDDAEASGILFRHIQERIVSMPAHLRDKIVGIMGDSWAAGHLFKHDSNAECYQPSLFPSEYVTPFELGGSGEVPDMDLLSSEAEGNWFQEILGQNSKLTYLDTHIDCDIIEEVVKGCVEVSENGPRIIVAGEFRNCPDIEQGECHLYHPREYLCVLRSTKSYELARHGFLADLDIDLRRFLSSVAVWETLTEDGYFGEIQVVGRSRELQRELSCTEIPDCLDYCPLKEDCYYLRAVRTSESCSTILTPLNVCFDPPVHADIAVIFGIDDVLNAWEARQPRLDLGKLANALNEAGYSDCAQQAENISKECLNVSGGRADSIMPQEFLDSLNCLQQDLGKIVDELRSSLRVETESFIEVPMDPPIMSSVLHSLEHWRDEMIKILSDDVPGLTIISKGYSFGNQVTAVLSKKTVWPASYLKDRLFEVYRNVVFVSPQISFINRYQGLRKLYGIDEDSLILKIPDRSRVASCNNSQVLLVCVDSGRFLSGRDHVEFVGGFLEKLMTNIPENVLCLCPSYSFARDLNDAVAPKLEDSSIAVFAQGIDGGPRILEHLMEPDTLVLLRFGVSIADPDKIGPRILAIPRIPFSPPSIVYDLRREDLNRMGVDGFLEASVLPVALSLRSYIETIVRSTGRLAVIFLDPKVLPGQRGWGKDFMGTFDDMSKVVCLPDEAVARVAQWLKA